MDRILQGNPPSYTNLDSGIEVGVVLGISTNPHPRRLSRDHLQIVQQVEEELIPVLSPAPDPIDPSILLYRERDMRLRDDGGGCGGGSRGRDKDGRSKQDGRGGQNANGEEQQDLDEVRDLHGWQGAICKDTRTAGRRIR